MLFPPTLLTGSDNKEAEKLSKASGSLEEVSEINSRDRNSVKYSQEGT